MERLMHATHCSATQVVKEGGWRHAMKLGLLEQSIVDTDLRRFPVIPVQR